MRGGGRWRRMRPFLFGGAAVVVLVGLAAALVVFGRGGIGRQASAIRATASANLPGVAPSDVGAGSSPAAGSLQQSPARPAGPPQSVISFTGPATLKCDKGQALAFVNLSWRTANTTAVSISIDGPAKFADGGPSGSTTLPFGCSDAQHTYILATDGTTGPAATKSVVVKRA